MFAPRQLTCFAVTEGSGLAQNHPIWNDNHFDFASLEFEAMFDLPQHLNTWYGADQARGSIAQMQGDNDLSFPTSFDLDCMARPSSGPNPKTSQIIFGLSNHNSKATTAAPAATLTSNVESALPPVLQSGSEKYTLAGPSQLILASGSAINQDIGIESASEKSGNTKASARSQLHQGPSLTCDQNGCEDITFQCKSTWQ